MKTEKALVVLSGGQDSTTCLAFAIQAFGVENVSAITFDYGQRHIRELGASRQIAKLFGIADRHEIIRLGDHLLAGTSPLTDPTQALETYENHEQMEAIIGNRVEKTFVPMRNALFLTIAANRAVVSGHHTIYTGVCQADNANYPDCRAEFIGMQQLAINEALGIDYADPKEEDLDRRITIATPLMYLTKEMSITRFVDLCGPTEFCKLAWSHTAYDGQYPPMGKDHASVLRAEGFLRSKWPDPLVVRAHLEGLMNYPGTENYKSPHVISAMEAIIADLYSQVQA